MEMKKAESVIVSVDFSHGEDVGVLIVGKQMDGHMEIINAFQGKDAEELWEKLVGFRRENKDD
jgi:hypothetical protein